jgi:hypothetical protein
MTWNLIRQTRRGFRYYRHTNASDNSRIVIANNTGGAPDHYTEALWLDYRRPLVLDVATHRLHVPVRMAVTEEPAMTSEPSHAAVFLCDLWRQNGGEIVAKLGGVNAGFVRALDVEAQRALFTAQSERDEDM